MRGRQGEPRSVDGRARRVWPAIILAIVLTGSAAAAAGLLLAAGGSQESPTALPAPGAAAAASAPVEVEIPAIGVRSRLIDLATDATGELLAPEPFDVAGWFAAGVAPGDVGPALIAGHVDSKAGPAIFYKLGQLKPGEQVLVHRADGSTVAFRVTTTTVAPKAAFPTQLVYGPTPGPELRLVTCGGRFVRAVGSYADNVIVEAVAA